MGPPEAVFTAEQIDGGWQVFAGEDNDAAGLAVAKALPDQTLRVATTEWDDESKAFKMTEFSGHFFLINGHSYFQSGDFHKADEPKDGGPSWFSFFRVEAEGEGAYAFYPPVRAPFLAAVRAGILKGKVPDEDEIGSDILLEDGKALRTFIGHHEVDMLFPRVPKGRMILKPHR